MLLPFPLPGGLPDCCLYKSERRKEVLLPNPNFSSGYWRLLTVSTFLCRIKNSFIVCYRCSWLSCKRLETLGEGWIYLPLVYFIISFQVLKSSPRFGKGCMKLQTYLIGIQKSSKKTMTSKNMTSFPILKSKLESQQGFEWDVQEKPKTSSKF